MALGADAIDRYAREGYLAPLAAFGRGEMSALMQRLEALEALRGGRLANILNIKAHLVIPFLWDMVHDPRIVDPVAALLGPDLLCWGAGFFSKRPGEAQHVPWHQDVTYWGLSEPRALTAWVAFTPSHAGNGGLRVVPGSHTVPLHHADTRDPTNMLPGREEVAFEIDERDAVDIALEPGEMSLHHPLLVHGSLPNVGGERRVGFAIRYVAGDVRQTGGTRVSATLVAGADHQTFALERAPESDFHPDALRRNADIARNWIHMVTGEVARKRT